MFGKVGRSGVNKKGSSASAGPAIPQTNLLYWLSADSGVKKSDGSTAGNGDLVYTWTSKGPGSSVVTASSTASGSCPTLATNVVNGQPALTFGNADNFQLPASANLAAFDIYVVLAKDATGSDSIITGSSNSFSYLVVRSTGGTQMLQPSAVSAEKAYAGYSGTPWMIIGGRNDGTTLTARAGNGTTATAVASGNTKFDSIGWYLTGGTTSVNFAGKMAEYIFYSAALSPADRTTVENYLKTKYNLL